MAGARSKISTNPLDVWLRTNGLTRAQFADHIAEERSQITRLCNEDTWPNRKLAAKIRAATGGAVTVADFVDPALADGIVAMVNSQPRSDIPTGPNGAP